MRAITLLLLAGCAFEPPPDALGPFNDVRRFAVDKLLMPAGKTYADDLDGDGKRDNQLGAILSVLAYEKDTVQDPSDQIAAGAIASVLEVSSDRPGARYGDGAGGDFVGGTGMFTSNRTRWTHHPASMTVRLPVFADADPLDIPLVGVEIDLAADGDGWSGTLRGAILRDDVLPLVISGTRQMLTNNPADHGTYFDLLDVNHDGVLSDDEIGANSILTNLYAPDVDLYDNDNHWHPGYDTILDALSVAFAFHAVPSGSALPPVRDLCRDRVTDNDESDHDCGGTTCSLRCAAGKHCNANADCMSGVCVGTGTASICAAKS
jgi:hypothetical protein